jgi:hypothetical protein
MMITPRHPYNSAESLKRDWRQFRLLSKDAVRQLIDAALLSREADPMQFAIWMLALVATPTGFFALQQVNTYALLLAVEAPVAVVHQLALGHRLFFVTYAMLTSTLLASLMWEALFPDGRDQEIIGVLPVRPYVFAASRLSAALTVAVVFTAAVNLPAAIIYSVFAVQHPAFHWNLPGLVLGHALGTMLASMLVFCTLLTVRGLAAILFGAGAGKWLGALLQLFSVVLLVEVLFFLPGVLGTAVSRVTRGDPTLLSLPPVWFAAMHAWLVGTANRQLEEAMIRGLVATAIAVAAVVPIYLLPARWLGKRALEKKSRERAAGTTFVVGAMSALTGARPAVRAVFLFAMVSLVRSRRHLIVLASYIGVALAACMASILLIVVRRSLLFDTPASWMLALPMLFLFFGMFGLRASFRIPTELDANWPFRLSQPSLATCVNALLLIMFTVAVLPVAAITMLAIASLWSVSDVVAIVLLQMLAGVLLAECLLFRWTKVPFACAHAPSPDVLKAWWPLYAFAMYLFAFKLADWQFAALHSPRAGLAYVAVLLMMIAGIRVLRHRELRHKQLEFDLVENGAVARLDLSGALH